jgi:hypothetical protein
MLRVELLWLLPEMRMSVCEKWTHDDQAVFRDGVAVDIVSANRPTLNAPNGRIKPHRFAKNPVTESEFIQFWHGRRTSSKHLFEFAAQSSSNLGVCRE